MSKTKKEFENQILRLLDLPPDVEVESSEIKADSEVITLRLPQPGEMICPNCGESGCISRGSGRWQELQHFPVNNRSIILRIFKKRIFCPSCGKSSYVTPEWAIPRLRMTRQLFNAIFRLFTQMLAFSQIMRILLIGESTVRTVMDSIEVSYPNKLPETLCIDEFKADTGFYLKRRKKWCTDDYNVNLTDWNRKVVIDVLQQRNLAFLSKHFKRHYDKYTRLQVRFFVCDMSGSFISLAKECFPALREIMVSRLKILGF
ncbi:MAG: transposase [Lachnospiraceae bacterium]|nr:transposase [Lachnospiraceae bacterium]